MIDTGIRFISRLVLKTFAFLTQLGGYGVILLLLIFGAAEIDSKAVADIFAQRWVQTIQAENHTLTAETAKLIAHERLQGVAFWIVGALALCTCVFRVSPATPDNMAMKKAAIWIAILLALVGIIGNCFTIMEANKGKAITIIFTDGYNLLTFLFGSVLACIPSALIEIVSMQIDKGYGKLLAKINASFYEKLSAKVEEELSNEAPAKKRTSFLSITPTAKTGTNS